MYTHLGNHRLEPLAPRCQQPLQAASNGYAFGALLLESAGILNNLLPELPRHLLFGLECRSQIVSFQSNASEFSLQVQRFLSKAGPSK